MPESKDPANVTGSHAASRHSLNDTAEELVKTIVCEDKYQGTSLEVAEKLKFEKSAKNKSRLNALGTIGEQRLMVFYRSKTPIS